jgi:hypothetical protein
VMTTITVTMSGKKISVRLVFISGLSYGSCAVSRENVSERPLLRLLSFIDADFRLLVGAIPERNSGKFRPTAGGFATSNRMAASGSNR